MLRGKKPTTKAKRMKALFYGAAGAGKTTAAINFPRPYLIDTERGAENDQYVTALRERDGAILQTNSFLEIVAEVRSLLSDKHEYRTLIIDPVTTIWDDLLAVAEDSVGNEFGRHYGEARKQWKRLGNLLMRLDMNVIITSHQKNLYGDNLKVLGQTFDGPKGLDYLFDLVFEVQKRGTDRVGIVRKTRVESFPEGDIFPFAYDEVAERYGRDVLERDAVPTELASAELVAEFSTCIENLKNADDIVAKLLKDYDAADLTEIPAERIKAGIAHFTPSVPEETTK